MADLRAARVFQLLDRKVETERELAGVLREHLDEVGETAWLEWCAKHWGWGRSTAYLHLDPEQLQAKRKRDRNRQTNVRESRTFAAETQERIRARVDKGPGHAPGDLIRFSHRTIEWALQWVQKDYDFSNVTDGVLEDLRLDAALLRDRLIEVIAVLDARPKFTT
jgi:hypothetical protein